MSIGAYLVWSEGINRVTFGLWLNEWLQPVAIGHIDRDRKQILQVLGDADILEPADWRVWFKLDHDVDVAGLRRVAAREGTKQGDMQHPSPAEFRFVGTQGRYDSVAVHRFVNIRISGSPRVFVLGVRGRSDLDRGCSRSWIRLGRALMWVV